MEGGNRRKDAGNRSKKLEQSGIADASSIRVYLRWSFRWPLWTFGFQVGSPGSLAAAYIPGGKA